MNKQTPLREIMTTKVQKVQELDTLERVAYLFEKYDFHHIPVEDEEANLVGIVSRADFNTLSYGLSLFGNPDKEIYNQALYKTTLVRDVMTKIVVNLRPEDPASFAARIFGENLFHALPIVESGKLVGIVTTFDLLKMAFR
ncbi:MAG: CBS domain-containing protein [Saprospiraceae bacterium]